MALFDEMIWKVLNQGERQITEPIFVKDFSQDEAQIDRIEAFLPFADEEQKKFMERDIAFLRHGIAGEKNVYFELKNSFMPMLVLHDIRLEQDGHTAQMDFVIITKKFIMVLETKKLAGDIEITQDGDFIRLFKNSEGKVYKKEGIYSPISQNQRHVDILKNIFTKANIIKRFKFISLVVIANPKTILDKRKCPKEIADCIVKYDQIKTVLQRELDDSSNDRDLLEKYIFEMADYLVDHHVPQKYDILKKYNISQEAAKLVGAVSSGEKLDKAESKLYDELKEYRLYKSREEKIKAFYIFNNDTLEALVECKPKTMEDLLQIRGIGKEKAEKYGNGILAIIKAN